GAWRRPCGIGNGTTGIEMNDANSLGAFFGNETEPRLKATTAMMTMVGTASDALSTPYRRCATTRALTTEVSNMTTSSCDRSTQRTSEKNRVHRDFASCALTP